MAEVSVEYDKYSKDSILSSTQKRDGSLRALCCFKIESIKAEDKDGLLYEVSRAESGCLKGRLDGLYLRFISTNDRFLYLLKDVSKVTFSEGRYKIDIEDPKWGDYSVTISLIGY